MLGYKDRLFELEKQMYGITFDKSIQNLREKYNASNILESIGYLVCGPMYVGFCEQAVQIAKAEGIKLILPVMREGMLYKPILDILLEDETDFTVIPICVSRRTSFLCMIESEFNYQFFKEICFIRPYKISVAFTRLGLEEYSYLYQQNEEEIDKELAIGNENGLKKLYDCICKNGLIHIAVSQINSAREGLREYLKFVGIDRDFVTVDIGSSGTIPRAVDNCSINNIKKIHLYLSTWKDVCIKKHDIRTIFSAGKVDTREYDIAAAIFFHFWESIAMGDIDRGTAIEYHIHHSGVDVICEKKSIDKYTFDTVRKIKKGIIEFTQEYSQIRKSEKIDTYKMLLDGVGSFYRMIEHPQKVEAELLGVICANDSALTQDFRLIANNNIITQGEELLAQKLWNMNGMSSMWVQGANMLRNSRNQKECYFNCVVFGAGQDGVRAIEWIQNQGGQVDFIIDNYKCGNSYEGIPIVSIDALGQYSVEDILIASTRYEKELEAQLLEYMNVNNKTYNIHYIRR